MISKLKQLLDIAKSNEGLKHYGKNTSWLMAEKILGMFVGLFVGIWIARYLGPEQFGLLSYAQSFVFLFTTVATLGLDSIVVRELVKEGEKRDALLGTAFGLKLLGALLVLPILGLAVQFSNNDSYTNLLVFIIASATIFQSFNVIDFYYQSQVMSKYVVLANTISLFLSSIVKIVLILNHAPLIAFAIMTIFDSLVLALGLVYFYFKTTGHNLCQWQFDSRTAKQLLKDSWPLALSSGVLMIQAYIDQIMLKEMLGSEEVGYYSVAIRLIAVFGFIPVVLKSSLFPAIQNAKQTSRHLYKDRLLNFYRLNFILFVLCALPIFLFAKPIIILLFGAEYSPAAILLALMAFRLFFANMGVARGAYLVVENLMLFSLFTMIIGTVANIALNYWWIPDYGAKGSVVATLVSFFITIYAIDIFYSKTRDNAILQIKSIMTFYRLRTR